MSIDISQNLMILKDLKDENCFHFYRKVWEYGDNVLLCSIEGVGYIVMEGDGYTLLSKKECYTRLVSIEEVSKVCDRMYHKDGIVDNGSKFHNGDIVYIYSKFNKTKDLALISYEKATYITYDRAMERHVVQILSSKHTCSYDNEHIFSKDDLIAIYSSYIEKLKKEKEDLVKLHDDLSSFDCYANIHINIAKLINLQTEYDTLIGYCRHSEQLHCIKKGIKRLKKRIYPVLQKYPDVSLKTIKSAAAGNMGYNFHLRDVENKINKFVTMLENIQKD